MKRIGSIKPRTYIIFLTLLGFILRALVAITSDHVHYPDEIFQSLEQAHRLVFGYGIIPWEFQQGVRSWLLPGFLSLVLYLFKFLQIDQPQNYILAEKLVLCLCATSLIPASYLIAKEFATEKAGVLAAFFACFWYELGVLCAQSIFRSCGNLSVPWNACLWRRREQPRQDNLVWRHRRAERCAAFAVVAGSCTRVSHCGMAMARQANRPSRLVFPVGGFLGGAVRLLDVGRAFPIVL